jgi:hypothetical protein
MPRWSEAELTAAFTLYTHCTGHVLAPAGTAERPAKGSIRRTKPSRRRCIMRFLLCDAVILRTSLMFQEIVWSPWHDAE